MIVVLGSINLDLVATVAHLPRAGETQSARAFATSPGGKGANQALAARRAGSSVAMAGAVGRDAFAAPALASLREAGVDLSRVAAVEAPTGVALIHVDAAGENTITVVPGANARVQSEQVEDALLGPGTTLLLQLEIPLPEVVALAGRGRRAGARVVLNAAPVQTLGHEILALIDVLVVNEHEARAIAAGNGRTGSPESLARGLAARGPTVVVTLGAEGALAAVASRLLRVPAPTIRVIDTVGAGDAFAGAMAAALDRGDSPADALRDGVAAGALACCTSGAQASAPDRAAVAALSASLPVHG